VVVTETPQHRQNMKIAAVTFDVGGTLIQPWPSVGRVYAEVAARHGVRNLPAERLEARFKSAWRAEHDFAYTRDAWAELVDRTFLGLCARPPSETFFPDLYEHFAQPVAWRIFDDVVPALEELATNGVRLGVISNWDERLRVLLGRLKLDGFFETVVVSCEVGFAKPSPVVFAQAAEKLGLPPASILHVGDSFEMDVQGAKTAGFEVLRVIRQGTGPSANAIHSLAGLAARITKPISTR
jgi:putative hydrolase of the HAD superfamily